MVQPGDEQPELNFETAALSGFEEWRSSVHPEIIVEPVELDFASGGQEVTVWRGKQAERSREIARREGLPIGEKVRLVLKSELELVGRLILESESGNFRIEDVTFGKAEIVSCHRVA